MSVRTPRRVAAALTALALGAGLAAAAPASAASSTPPWEPVTQAAGTLTFYNASGTAITSGSTNSTPFANYVEASGDIRSGDTKARLEFANPRHDVDSTKWYVADLGTTSYPVANAPAALPTGKPTWTGASGTGETLEQFESASNIDQTAGYTNYVQVRLQTYDSNGNATAKYAVADIYVDAASHTWTEAYPTNTTTGTAHTSRLDVAASTTVNYGTTVTYLARLYDTSSGLTPVAGKKLNFYGRSSSSNPFGLLGSTTTGSDGRATITFKPAQTDQFYFAFAGDGGLAQANSATVTTTVDAVFTLATVNHSSIKSGQTVGIYGSLAPGITGQKVYLQQLSNGSYFTTQYNEAIANRKLLNGQTAYGYNIYVKLTRKTTYTFRMYVPATSIRGAGFSKSFSVRVS